MSAVGFPCNFRLDRCIVLLPRTICCALPSTNLPKSFHQGIEKRRRMMNSSSSPAHSSASTTTLAGGNGGGSKSSNIGALPNEEFHFPIDLSTSQDRKDDALLALKSDLMASLNKEVKSLDDDNWKFEGPRSRIHLILRPSNFLTRHGKENEA